MKKIVAWLEKEQKELQKRFETKIGKTFGYDNRGIWVKATCICGYDFTTVGWIPKNGKCPECKKYVFRVKK